MAKIKHGGCGTPLYNVWKSMRQRCNNRRSHDYIWYGADGIRICKEWSDFSNFRNWAVNSGYQKGLTIDRIDVNGDYCPENCRWVTIQEQQKNKRNVLRFQYSGSNYTVETFCKEFHISMQMFYDRKRKGWSLGEIATTPKVKAGGYREKGVRVNHG